MSAVIAETRPRRSVATSLRAIAAPRRRRRPRLLYGVVAVAGAFAIGAAQMGLSILTMQSSYELSELTREQQATTYQKQILQDDISGLSSPQYLAANAAALGMVIGEPPSFLRLSDNAIVGAGAAATGTSSIDALGRPAVSNAIIAATPLVTAPDATIEGAPVETPATTDAATPPPIAEGLPTPTTH